MKRGQAGYNNSEMNWAGKGSQGRLLCDSGK